jgi:hypothetical protein
VTAHKGLLTAESVYFATYFASPNADHTISFADPAGITTDIDVLKTYTQWLYTRVLSVDGMLAENKFSLLARSYIFGEKLASPVFCNAVMVLFISLHVSTQKVAFGALVPLVYGETMEDSPLRLLLADMYAYTLDSDPGLKDVLWELQKVFLVDVVAAMVGMRKVKGMWEKWWRHLEREAYHWDTEVEE